MPVEIERNGGYLLGQMEGEQTEGISCAKALWLEASAAERARDRMVGGEADVSTRDCIMQTLTGRLKGFIFILSSRGRK